MIYQEVKVIYLKLNLFDGKDTPAKEKSQINKDDNTNFTDDNNNNKLKESNKESKSSLGFSKIKMGSLINEPNNDLLNDILRNVETSQSIIRKNNSNQANPQSSNINNMNNITNKNINPEEPKKKKNIDNNLTKNLNDLMDDAKLDNNIDNHMILSKNNDVEVKNILDNVDTSQTILNKKDKEIKNILNEVQTSNSNFKDININNNNDTNNIQSIDDIRKMFNDEYKPNGMSNISNIYGNNNIRDTKINNIFKSEMITSDSFTRNSSSKQNGPYKPDLNIPKNMQNYNFYGYENKNYNQRRNYNIKPSHEHKIIAITNLLEDLNLDNLIAVKNHIINKLNGQK